MDQAGCLLVQNCQFAPASRSFFNVKVGYHIQNKLKSPPLARRQIPRRLMERVNFTRSSRASTSCTTDASHTGLTLSIWTIYNVAM